MRLTPCFALAMLPIACGANPSTPAAPNAGPRITIAKVASGFTQPTDVQFPPGRSDLAIVLGKKGTAWWVRPADGSTGRWFTVDVSTASEQGLLGLAFHPKFAENGLFYLNYTLPRSGTTRIAEWSVASGADPTAATPTEKRVLLEVPQPYANHNAGQLQFGPDGFLYIGLGDGGSGGDPHGHGQNPNTLLGSMLRIDVDRAGEGTPYAIPPDNPFVGNAAARQEVWAYGLRNPWRYAFAPDGRLVVADVGQNAWEEVDIVEKGGNYGWNVREGRHCYEPARNCATDGLIEPIFEYGRDLGASITGGYVYDGAIAELKGRYLFGDFATGRVWALELPDGVRPVEAVELGKFPIALVTFGRDAAGEVYLADFGEGVLYRFATE